MPGSDFDARNSRRPSFLGLAIRDIAQLKVQVRHTSTTRAELDPLKSHEIMLQLMALLHDHADFMRVMTYHMFRELLRPHH